MTVISATYLPFSSSDASAILCGIELLQNMQQELKREFLMQRRAAARRLRSSRIRARRLAYQSAAKGAERSLQAELLILQHKYVELVQQAKEDCVNLSIGVIERILGEQFTDNSNLITARIEEAIRALIDRRALKITVNPLDEDSVAKDLKQLLETLPFKLISDSEITRGDAIVESISGKIELSWQAQLDLIKSKMIYKLSIEKGEQNAIAQSSK